MPSGEPPTVPPSAKARRSMPAQNALSPVPVSTTARTSGSFSASTMPRPISVRSSGLRELRASGRFSRRTETAPRRSFTSTGSDEVDPCGAHANTPSSFPSDRTNPSRPTAGTQSEWPTPRATSGERSCHRAERAADGSASRVARGRSCVPEADRSREGRSMRRTSGPLHTATVAAMAHRSPAAAALPLCTRMRPTLARECEGSDRAA